MYKSVFYKIFRKIKYSSSFKGKEIILGIKFNFFFLLLSSDKVQKIVIVMPSFLFTAEAKLDHL